LPIFDTPEHTDYGLKNASTSIQSTNNKKFLLRADSNSRIDSKHSNSVVTPGKVS
jgi:hypothetical protein